jgi:glyoxylase-like metal-dependent hydrolase (beta-lactamase superfamily II)
VNRPAWVEVGDRCWTARHRFLDVNISVVAGERGLLVVDTMASSELARAALDDVRRLSAAPLLVAVNTHAHFDHSFGNGVFAAEGAELVCHEGAAAELPEHAERIRQLAAEDDSAPEHAGIAATEPVVPERRFSSAMALDLGDRAVELVHPGRGHTGGDLVVRVPDADVVLAGDLVEESTIRSGVVGYGPDSWPLEWPSTLDLVLELLGEESVVVPGHGAPVGRDFVFDQRSTIGVVAETIRDLAGRGVPVELALGTGQWPWPAEELEHAVRRGYEQLPRSAKGLPLA